MSSNSKPYPKTVGALKTFADEVGTYPLRALLVAGYVYDDGHEFADDITDELSGSGYARVDLDNVLYTATDSDAAITADDVVFASLTATGIDVDGDGTIDEAEVTEATYVRDDIED